MAIPRIVHQIWRDGDIPRRWRAPVASVKLYHPGWRYELWTDDRAARHIAEAHPLLYPVYTGLSRDIMRADVLRYVLMHDFGGMYCDLDFEFLRPWPYCEETLLLSLERDRAYGDPEDAIANYFFASAPGHPLWRLILDDVVAAPPLVQSYADIPETTGPGLVSRIFWKHQAEFPAATVTPRPTFSPHRTHARGERAQLLNNGITHGLHWGSGSWKERGSPTYLARKVGKILGLRSST
jgi:mannosyltransferase OCH1-like enzyme